MKLASEDNFPSGNKYLDRNILSRKKSTRFKTYEKSPSPSKHSKTLLARQMKQYETIRPIKNRTKPEKPKKTKMKKVKSKD